MSNIKKIGKKKLFLLILALLVIIILIVVTIKNLNTDGVENKGILKVYYRTYTKEKGWSRWVKNGKTSGNELNDIKNIQIKIKQGKDDKVVYRFYDTKWSKEYNINTKIKNRQIKAIKLGLTSKLSRKYDVCYRTYNNDNKWLEWSCNGGINGNKNRSITAIEVRIIPRDIVKYDYLKDYNKSEFDSSIGF